MNELNRLHHFLGEAELQLLKTGKIQLAAEIDNTSITGTGRFSQFGNRHPNHLSGIGENEVGNRTRTRPKRGMPHSNARHDIVDYRHIRPSLRRHFPLRFALRHTRPSGFHTLIIEFYSIIIKDI